MHGTSCHPKFVSNLYSLSCSGTTVNPSDPDCPYRTQGNLKISRSSQGLCQQACKAALAATGSATAAEAVEAAEEAAQQLGRLDGRQLYTCAGFLVLEEGPPPLPIPQLNGVRFHPAFRLRLASLLAATLQGGGDAERQDLVRRLQAAWHVLSQRRALRRDCGLAPLEVQARVTSCLCDLNPVTCASLF